VSTTGAAVERLLDVAQRLADECPQGLGREVAVLGSVGAGLADEHSDLELLFLADDVPKPEAVRAWLGSIGARDAIARRDGESVSAWCRVDGVEVEPYWDAVATEEPEVDAILAGEALDHSRLALAHVLTHCVVLRDAGVIRGLAARLEPYPDDLALRLVEHALEGLDVPSAHPGAALRNDRLAVHHFLELDAYRALRIVFALNRRWEPPRWKWLRHWAADLEIAPPRLAERVEAALVEPDSVAAVRALQELTLEALELLPAAIDASDAKRGVAARLAQLDGVRS